MSAAELKVKTNTLPNSRISVELEVPSERCQSSYDEALSRLSRSVKLPGFRKGKVPNAVLIQQIGVTKIRATALETLIDRVWKEALDQESIEALCEPELKGSFEQLLGDFNPGKALTFILETDISPHPKLKSTKGITAEAESVKFDPSKVEDLLEQSRKQLATLIPV